MDNFNLKQYLVESKLHENEDDGIEYYLNEIRRDLEEIASDEEANKYLEDLASAILKLKRSETIDEDHSLDMVLNEMVKENLSPADFEFIEDNEVEIRDILKIDDDFEMDKMNDLVTFYDIKDEEGALDIISKDEYDRLQNELDQFEAMKLDIKKVNGRPIYIYDYRN